MRKLGLFISAFILFGCSIQQHEGAQGSQGTEQILAAEKHQDVQTQSVDWVDYADPVADANMAVDKGQLHLLAISSKGLSIPGVDLSQHDINELQRRCSLKQLSTGGDAVYSKSQLQKGKSIVAYAKSYNQVALKACLKRTSP